MKLIRPEWLEVHISQRLNLTALESWQRDLLRNHTLRFVYVRPQNTNESIACTIAMVKPYQDALSPAKRLGGHKGLTLKSLPSGIVSAEDNQWARPVAMYSPGKDYAVNIVFSLLCIIAYRRLAESYCDGRPHSLPTSPLLDGYPCGASNLVQAAYILRHAPTALYNIARAYGPDWWLAGAVMLVELRLLCVLLLPTAIYTRIAAPLSCYTQRALPYLCHLWMGSKHTLTQLGPDGLFLKHSAVEVVLFISCQVSQNQQALLTSRQSPAPPS